MIDRIVIDTGPAAGSAGSAATAACSPRVAGRVLAVHVAYHDSPPATTDVTLEDEHDPAAEKIVSLTDANTDVKLYPRRPLETNDGTGLTYDGTRKICGSYIVAGRLKAAIAGANANDRAVLTVWMEV